MPDSKTANESSTKQPTGSSKRKRKHAVKRNIVKENETTCLDVLNDSKVEKAFGKRLRTRRSKSEKDLEEVGMNFNENKIEETCQNNSEDSDELCNALQERSSKQKGEGSSNIAKCGFNNIQCQNCKFCSEHRETNPDSDDSSGKKSKNKFSCDLCAKSGSPKVYNSIEKHKHHMATVHEVFEKETKRFECTECPEKVWFPTKSKFTYHLGTKHPGIIKFICEVCTETFKLKANYKNHMKTHNIIVQKKFSCDVCNGTFVNKAGFEAHKKRFPGPHIKQSCSHCGFSFSREKHLINHRCKTLLLEEAAARGNPSQAELSQTNPDLQSSDYPLKVTSTNSSKKSEETQVYLEKKAVEISVSDPDLLQKKQSDSESQANKKVVLHRIISRRNQEPTAYRPVQVTNQNVPESVVVQELREIDFENGTFIAATGSGNESDQQQSFIVRDVNGHLVQGNQILQLDLNDIQTGEESQVYLADWNIVTPYVIREKSP